MMDVTRAIAIVEGRERAISYNDALQAEITLNLQDFQYGLDVANEAMKDFSAAIEHFALREREITFDVPFTKIDENFDAVECDHPDDERGPLPYDGREIDPDAWECSGCGYWETAYASGYTSWASTFLAPSLAPFLSGPTPFSVSCHVRASLMDTVFELEHEARKLSRARSFHWKMSPKMRNEIVRQNANPYVVFSLSMETHLIGHPIVLDRSLDDDELVLEADI